ncbi:MAG: sigma-70 family RNA polymerase sigma factor [Xanthomonadales bacterium]|nr:sigma-70 family RNA polymerase sigma factor [Xanthomonadales bacterium]
MHDQATRLLEAWRAGDEGARDRLIEAVYPELRAAAVRQLAGERSGHTLQPTALVNEVFLRLGGVARIDWQGHGHFVRVAARLMREILVDHARRRNAAKRDGGERLSLTQLDIAGELPALDLEALDDALVRLEALDADKGRIVELRYFAGLTIEETAAAMAMSPATVKRHWQAARTWLYDALAD